MGYKEQFLLYLDRPAVNFGHARWREGAQESYDASAWLAVQPGRVLLIPEAALEPCFESTRSTHSPGVSSGDRWLLVRGTPNEACVKKGERRSRADLHACVGGTLSAICPMLSTCRVE